ncbi:peptidoglycan-binding protein [Melghirimyces algeriensis]|uniref:N-acetylmuramoyl-L-alanine amidase n=1 Tax=Melghirimyces algeriensis TaxID=910412 RepID=A0A521C6Z0_9BACL|nr:peptidoglycan-binding protein [Melghirimyces algeriensis]SMO55199.1 N-acetylmuramoyl-L-alanine amidase [Melghirimyces algeriensis]
MKTEKQYIPKRHEDIRPGIRMKPRYITIHNTGNTDKGADADAHARLLKRGNSRQASWHFTVDDEKVVQHLPTDEVGWHAGDGRGPGNMSSIGVEICENWDGDFAQAEANTAQLVRRLCDELDIPVSRVVPHRHWSGKNCPHRTLKHWSQFIQKVKGSKWDGKSFPGRDAFKTGKSHPAVTVLGKRLVAHGFGKHYKVGPGPTFSEADRKNVQDFQKAQGWSGSDADGYPGPVTWERLMKEAPSEKKKLKEFWRLYKNGEQFGYYDVDENARKKILQVLDKAMDDNEKEINIKVERDLKYV